MAIVKHVALNLKGSAGGRISQKVTSTDDLQWVVIDTTHQPILIAHHAAHNPSGGESVEVTVVRSRFTLAELGGEIDPDDARVDVLVDEVETTAGAINEGADDDASHALYAVGIASAATGVHSADVHLVLGVSA